MYSFGGKNEEIHQNKFKCKGWCITWNWLMQKQRIGRRKKNLQKKKKRSCLKRI
jgi:hypothetical protein